MDDVWEVQFFFHGYHYFQTGWGAHTASYPMGTRRSFTRGKAMEAEFEAEGHHKPNFPYIFRDVVRI
jgi:hypothetical protein